MVSLNFDDVSATSSIALSFTESPLFINPLASDDSSGPFPNMSYDGVLSVPAPLPTGHWTQPADKLRGGFRFLTISSTSNGSVSLSNVSCYLNFMPHVESLTNYSGYFYALDPEYVDENFLTRASHLCHCSESQYTEHTVAVVFGRLHCTTGHYSTEYWSR